MKSPPSYLPSRWEWSNFTTSGRSRTRASGTRCVFSLYVAGMSTLLALAVGLPAAYYTARHRFRGRGAFLLLVLVTQMFAPTALLVGIYREMVSLDLTDTAEGLILVNAAFNLPFCVWILNAYFASIPRELEEAACMDGTGRLGALVRVILPLAMPGVVTALVYTFIGAWNEYVVALTITSSSDRTTLTKAIPGFVTSYHEQWQYLFATSLDRDRAGGGAVRLRGAPPGLRPDRGRHPGMTSGCASRPGPGRRPPRERRAVSGADDLHTRRGERLGQLVRAALSVTSMSMSSTGQMRAKARRPSLEESATTTTCSARRANARLMLASPSCWAVAPWATSMRPRR